MLVQILHQQLNVRGYIPVLIRNTHKGSDFILEHNLSLQMEFNY